MIKQLIETIKKEMKEDTITTTKTLIALYMVMVLTVFLTIVVILFIGKCL